MIEVVDIQNGKVTLSYPKRWSVEGERYAFINMGEY